MKKKYFLLLLLIPFWANAQMNTWEHFTDKGVKHPFKNDSVQVESTDTKGNIWKLDSDYLLSIKGTDTTKFTNFPGLEGNYHYNQDLSVVGDHVAFYRYDYNWNNNIVEYTNYLGFYDGTTLSFIKEADMDGPLSTQAFSSLKQTKEYIWITKGNKLVGYHKFNASKSYTPSNSVITDVISEPRIYQTDLSSIILQNNRVLYIFEDEVGEWSKLLPNDSVLYVVSSNSNNELYIAGKNKLYIYKDKTLQSYDVPNLSALGDIRSMVGIKENSFVCNYSNGFVFVINGQAYVKRFADYTAETNVYYAPNYSAPNLSLDNGILILRYQTNKYENLYFSFYNNELKFEVAKPNNNYYSFYYKTLNGDNYYYYSTYDQGRLPTPNSLVIVKNGKDTTSLTLPKEVQYVMGIAADSNFVWINNETMLESPYRIFRMSRDQYFVKGRLFYDINKNGLQDVGEVGVSKYPLVINPSGITVFADRDGNYAFAGVPGEEYTVDIPADSLFNYVSATLPYLLKDSDNNAIGFTIANPMPEIRTNFNTPWPRCGTTGKANLQIENLGYYPIEKVQLVLTGDALTEINSTDALIKKTDTLVFEITNLSPLAAKSLSYEVTFPGAEKTGEKLNFNLYSVIYDNAIPFKSTVDSINSVVRCSFDPNDKSVTPAGQGEKNLTLKDVDLNYLIRFENTGNDTAYTVTVYDTLDVNLDKSTVEVLGSSHNVITELTKNGVLIFHFDDIMLPDNKTNKDKAQGFVRFSVKPKTDIAENTVVKNKAGIVFDSNVPVITNETFNTLVTTFPVLTSINNAIENNEIVYPNPAKDKVQISLTNAARVEVYDFTGKQVYVSAGSEVNTSAWEQGFYLFRLYDSNGKVLGTKKVLIEK